MRWPRWWPRCSKIGWMEGHIGDKQYGRRCLRYAFHLGAHEFVRMREF